jgi:hypothetical protein
VRIFSTWYLSFVALIAQGSKHEPEAKKQRTEQQPTSSSDQMHTMLTATEQPAANNPPPEDTMGAAKFAGTVFKPPVHGGTTTPRAAIEAALQEFMGPFHQEQHVPQDSLQSNQQRAEGFEELLRSFLRKPQAGLQAAQSVEASLQREPTRPFGIPASLSHQRPSQTQTGKGPSNKIMPAPPPVPKAAVPGPSRADAPLLQKGIGNSDWATKGARDDPSTSTLGPRGFPSAVPSHHLPWQSQLGVCPPSIDVSSSTGQVTLDEISEKPQDTMLMAFLLIELQQRLGVVEGNAAMHGRNLTAMQQHATVLQRSMHGMARQWRDLVARMQKAVADHDRSIRNLSATLAASQPHALASKAHAAGAGNVAHRPADASGGSRGAEAQRTECERLIARIETLEETVRACKGKQDLLEEQIAALQGRGATAPAMQETEKPDDSNLGIPSGFERG